jgi:thiopeptide-type bacteriocin biosynthesis protein
VRGPEGRYLHELVIPFVRRPGVDAPVVASSATASAAVRRGQRSFPPGGEWFYARLYGGRATADHLLTQEVAPLIRTALKDGLCDRWFFIRLNDPDDHLRVRVHGNPGDLAREFGPAFHAASEHWLANGLIWRVQLDTYEREVERFGGLRAMGLSEQVFAADSDAVVDILGAASQPRDLWLHALRGIHQLLLDFRLDAPQRQTLLDTAAERLGRELGADAPFWRQIGARYREERKTLEAHFALPVPPWLRERSRRLVPIVRALRTEEAAGRLTVSVEALARIFVHLHVNRSLRSAWRQQELVLLSLLSRLARAEGGRTPPAAGTGV